MMELDESIKIIHVGGQSYKSLSFVHRILLKSGHIIPNSLINTHKVIIFVKFR
jgi:hypothetical protein